MARGITLIEMLVVLAVVGILVAIAAASLRVSNERQAANSFQALMQQARTEAIKRNRPVVVSWDASGNVMLASVAPTMVVPGCGDVDLVEIDRIDVREYRRVTVTTTMPGNGVVWLPNGRHVACVSQGALSSVTTFTGASGSRAVEVSIGGSVRVQ